jgi:dTDP-4-dehydrorhamnose reductase
MSGIMRVLITGAGGMLGTEAKLFFASEGHDVIATSRLGGDDTLPLDVTDPRAVHVAFRDLTPDLVLHCAANTNVDGCERDPDAAYRGNALATWSVAAASEEIGATLVAVSTDFVFDGALDRPYTEFDVTNPLGQYGASKLAAENLALQHCRRTFVVRTSWLYGLYGKNFVFTIAGRARSGGDLYVVADQRGTPTWTYDLVRFLPRLVDTRLYGRYHLNNAGATSWYEFARAIVAGIGCEGTPVHPLTSDECAERFATPTRRPQNSVMRRYALELLGMDTMRPWDAALAEFIAEAKRAGKL